MRLIINWMIYKKKKNEYMSFKRTKNKLLLNMFILYFLNT